MPQSARQKDDTRVSPGAALAPPLKIILGRVQSSRVKDYVREFNAALAP